MSIVSIKQLLEAGVHFGHHTRRWNPKMAEYIFTERNGIYIIDLQKTIKKFEEAYMFARDIASDGGTILFVGTKKQAADAIREEAERCGMYYVNVRWLGGMLTNYKTIRMSINRLASLEKMQEDVSNTCSLSGSMSETGYQDLIKMIESQRKFKKWLAFLPFPLIKRMMRWAVMKKKTDGFTAQEKVRKDLSDYLKAVLRHVRLAFPVQSFLGISDR